ncbi:hypothetical protein IMG5_028940 [Ichthyophthirius multifiliis]|uniref:Uncharacterized protein n=1 Tax=Ichthyophthirius multifiliis TaxID=5932 RepID=G0QLD0_ICHMU|nr:hypothetical protein IMG5_028940 [Ichthyophthirius multifiliis]EGR33976.1 hypothetical protein IMG5_028940 [Ichthyophthirius multifiliis]|eukprot:XP_004039280.1 hypothetical protein IMG5_028940 [Ichthyophthirius multifiliis]
MLNVLLSKNRIIKLWKIQIFFQCHFQLNYQKEFNNQVQENKNLLQENSFYQNYGWVGLQINLLDNVLKKTIVKFRLNGLKHYNQSQIIDNFDNIIQFPIDYLQKQISNNVNQTLVDEIKQFQIQQNKIIELNISQSVQIILQKLEKQIIFEKGNEYKQQLEINYQKNGYNKLNNIIYNCIGILKSLSIQTNINLTKNEYINNLAISIYDQNLEHFHEINELILSIIDKQNRNNQR